jgi:asparagine synthase (glutamine-hydrolysing)
MVTESQEIILPAMSGIAGLWSLDGQPFDRETLSRMSRVLAHRGPDGEGLRLCGPAGVACQHLWITPEEVGERQPLLGASGAILAMDGRIDNRDELLSCLRLSRGSSDATCALAAYEEWSDRFVERLNGEFAIAVLDPRRSRFIIARDAIGLRPLYYFQSRQLFAFASEIKALLTHPEVPRAPDDDGLADYLLVSSRPLDRQDVTCFAGISAVEPGHAVTATRARTTARRYWDFDPARKLKLKSIGEYADAFHDVFATAVRRRIRSAYPVAVSLSGGLDSSSIFCQALTEQRAKGSRGEVFGISFTGSGTDTDERRFLVDIERAYGVEIEQFPLERFTGLTAGIEDQIHAMEAPSLDYIWGVTSELHGRASRRGARTLLTGSWGDQVMFSSAYLVDLFKSAKWRTMIRHLREYPRWLGKGEVRAIERRFILNLARTSLPSFLLRPAKRLRMRLAPPAEPKTWLSDRFLRHALRFSHELATIGTGFHSAQARTIYLQARSKYHVHCMEWNNKVAAMQQLESALPFLDRDLIAFLMAIPGEVQNWRGVPRGLMREALRDVLPEPVRCRTWKANFTGAVNSGLAADLAVVVSSLSENPLGVRMGYLDPARLPGHVASMSAGLSGDDCTSSWNLADLFGFEVWLRVFFPGQSRHAGPLNLDRT